MAYETVTFTVADGVATITMNRPDVANALNLTMARELAELAIECDERDDVRAVILTGNGRFFSAGGDLDGFSKAAERAGALSKQMTMYVHSAVSRFSRMDAPLIGAVNGMAAGAGFSFAMSCDIVIVEESAQLLSAYTSSGLSPDGSSTYFLPRVVGYKRAYELMVLNRRLTAAEALEWGIATKVVPDGESLTQAKELAAKLASGPTKAYGSVKRLLHASSTETLETQMESESRAFADVLRTEDAQEGVAAFLEKRKPEYKGR